MSLKTNSECLNLDDIAGPTIIEVAVKDAVVKGAIVFYFK